MKLCPNAFANFLYLKICSLLTISQEKRISYCYSPSGGLTSHVEHTLPGLSGCYLLLFTSALNTLCKARWFKIFFFLSKPRCKRHVVHYILSHDPLQPPTTQALVCCIVNIILHGTQSECFKAQHLSISPPIYSVQYGRSLISFFYRVLVAQTGNLHFSWDFVVFMSVCVCVARYSLLNTGCWCTFFHYRLGYCILFNMFVIHISCWF